MAADVGLFVAFNHAINDPVAVGGHLGGGDNHVCKIPKISILSRKFNLETAVRGLELRELREVRSKPRSSRGNEALLNF